MPRFSKLQIAAIVILGSLTVIVWYIVFSEEPGDLTVAILDVGQGDAIFIETESGRQVLIDGGPGWAVLGELGDIMRPYDKSIDYLIITHTDFDHIAGLLDVIRTYDVGGVIENGFVADTEIYREWEGLLRDKNIPRTTVRAGDRLLLEESTWLEILGPTPEDFAPEPKTPNEVMIVGRLIHGSVEFLFTGDLERGDEIRLTQSDAEIASDVLKIPHHGSRYSSTDLFLQKVGPRYSVISVGSKNRFGHPHPETLGRISKLEDSTLLRTDTHGRIVFRSDGSSLTAARERSD